MRITISNRILLALVALVLLGLTLLYVVSVRTTPDVVPMVGARENVKLITPNGDITIIAKIDTGADLSSIDVTLARNMGIENIARRIVIITDIGRE